MYVSDDNLFINLNFNCKLTTTRVQRYATIKLGRLGYSELKTTKGITKFGRTNIEMS